MGNNQSVDVLGLGTYDLDLGGRKVMPFTKVLYAPVIIHNLLNIHMLPLCKIKVNCKDAKVYVIEIESILIGNINKNLYAIGQSGYVNSVEF